MEALPFALSVTHFVNSVGADAGFAAIIGLALLVVLYFAQARETHSLRDQATEADDRLAQLELRVASLTRTQARAPAPAPDTVSSAHSAVNPAAGAVLAGPAASAVGHDSPQRSMYRGAPAGVGAPALTAATRLIPGDLAHMPWHSPAGLPIAAAAPPAGSSSPAFADGLGIGLGPATAAGRANGVAPESITRPTAAGTQTSSPPPKLVALRAPHGGAGPSRGGRRRRRRASGDDSSRSRRGVVAVLGALAVVATVAVLLIVTSGPGATKASVTTSATTASRRGTVPKTNRRTKAVPVNPALVTVAVLNGTATANLAHTIGSRLAAVGYKEGAIVTASDQTRTATVVGYLPGHRTGALAVATSLKLHPASVAPVDPSDQALACPPPAPCPASVVVTVGSDLAAGA